MTETTKQTFVLTGATGFLGSHLMAALVERKHKLIILGRSAKDASLAERIAKLLAWFGLEDRSAWIETAETDLLKPFCGLETNRYRELCAKADQIIHCASDTRFSERHRRESTDTNVHSLRGIINFARDGDISCFHYVSTAYIADDTSSLCLETPVNSGKFANIYEETKARAEKEVTARCDRYAIPFTILRPSIVYGDSRTGRSTCFTALYHHVRSLYMIREIYLNDIQAHGGHKSRACGIHLDDDGNLHLPLKAFLPRRGYINLIPIDYFVSAVLMILEHAQTGHIYHLTSDAPKTMEDLASYCELFLKMKGLAIFYGDTPNGFIPNPAEALFNRFIAPYRPYLSDTRIFDRRNTNHATANLFPPELSYGIFERCMQYATDANWEKLHNL